jgi:hypothetical protein
MADPRFTRSFALFFGVCIAAGCAVGDPTDVPRDATRSDRSVSDRAPSGPDASSTPDASELDATLDVAPPPLDVPSPIDTGAPPPPCDPRFALSPNPPGDDAPFDVRFTDPTGHTYIGLDWSGPARPAWRFVDVVSRDPFTWLFRVQPTVSGRYTVTFTANDGARRLGSCTFDVRARGSVVDSGVTPPIDSGVPPVDSGTPPAGTFITRTGTEFYAGSARFRFIGMNSAGLTHYGAPPLMFARVDQIDADLQEMQRMGVRVVRVFAAAEDAEHSVVAARLRRVLDLAAARGIYVIAALTDFYGATPYHPRNDRRFYAPTPGFHIDILNAEFFRSGFRENYLPWVRVVVAQLANHPALFAWELGNEIKCDPDHRAFINFAREVSGTIRSLDGRHLITTGMITARWATDAEARELHNLPNIDFVTYHNYNGTREFADFDYAVARDTNKPLIVEEAGFSGSSRPSRVDGDIREHIDRRGARGYMQWGFVWVTPDNGNGDHEFGMDRLWHASDYEQLFAVYRDAAARYR